MTDGQTESLIPIYPLSPNYVMEGGGGIKTKVQSHKQACTHIYTPFLANSPKTHKTAKNKTQHLNINVQTAIIRSYVCVYYNITISIHMLLFF